jgi:hypothetical protein
MAICSAVGWKVPARRVAGVESIHAFEGTETIQTLIVGSDNYGHRRVQLTARQQSFGRIRLGRNHADPCGISVRQFDAGQGRHRRRGGAACS